MDIQRAAELLAVRSAKDFGNALKDRDDPFKDFYKSLPICIWMPCFPSAFGTLRS